MSSGNKKVVIERFDRPPLLGYVNRNAFLVDNHVELLGQEGSLRRIPLEEVKCVQMVREFPQDPAAQVPWVFQARPKLNGLWVRLRLSDGDSREGMFANNLLEVSAIGLQVTPPNLAGNVMQAFFPRTSLVDVTVLGVIGSPLRRPATKPKPQSQIDLFS